MLVITAINLRETISNILKGHIGTYTFSSGATALAIAILPDTKHGYSYPPTGTKVQGIEVVIIRPTPTTSLRLTGYASRLTWQIYLKQWDKSKNLVQVTEVLVQGLNKLGYAFESPIHVLPNERTGGIESVRVGVYEYSYTS